MFNRNVITKYIQNIYGRKTISQIFYESSSLLKNYFILLCFGMKGNKQNTQYLRDKYWTYDYRAYTADLQRRLTELIYNRFNIPKKQCSNIVTLIIWFYNWLSLKWDNEYLMFPKIRAEKWYKCIFLYRFYKSCWEEFEFKYQINEDWTIKPLWKVNVRKIIRWEDNNVFKELLESFKDVN